MRNLWLLAACMACGFVGATLALLATPWREVPRSDAAPSHEIHAAPQPASEASKPVDPPKIVHTGLNISEQAPTTTTIDDVAPAAELHAKPADAAPVPPDSKMRNTPFHTLDEIKDPKLRKALGQTFNMCFEETALNDVLLRMRSELRINAVCMKGVEGSSCVTLDLGGISGLMAVDLLADSLDVQWIEQEGSVVFMPKAQK